MPKILDGKRVRDQIREELKRVIASRSTPPTLAIIQVGNRPDSSAYIRQKMLFGDSIGAKVIVKQFSENAAESDIADQIKIFNAEREVNGIILQMPIPPHLSKMDLIELIDPKKDVDGLTSVNVKKLENGTPGLVPATARGIVKLLKAYNVEIKGKEVTVVGRSALVGKPTALLILSEHGIVTVAHSKTEDLGAATKKADILIVATGNPHLIGPQHVKEGQVVIDVGINMISGEKLEEEIGDKKLLGDVDFDAVKNIVGAISPVPGGVGPMTVASLFENLLEAQKIQNV